MPSERDKSSEKSRLLIVCAWIVEFAVSTAIIAAVNILAWLCEWYDLPARQTETIPPKVLRQNARHSRDTCLLLRGVLGTDKNAGRGGYTRLCECTAQRRFGI